MLEGEHGRSYFSKFEFKEKFSGEGDTSLNELLETFEINCKK